MTKSSQTLEDIQKIKILKSQSVFQSAFSLIEICIALLILSLSVTWAGEALIARLAYYQKAEIRQRAVALAWSIADSVKNDRSGRILQHNLKRWETLADQIYPGSSLNIVQEVTEARCIYTITIIVGREVSTPLQVSIVA